MLWRALFLAAAVEALMLASVDIALSISRSALPTAQVHGWFGLVITSTLIVASCCRATDDVRREVQRGMSESSLAGFVAGYQQRMAEEPASPHAVSPIR